MEIDKKRNVSRKNMKLSLSSSRSIRATIAIFESSPRPKSQSCFVIPKFRPNNKLIIIFPFLLIFFIIFKNKHKPLKEFSIENMDFKLNIRSWCSFRNLSYALLSHSLFSEQHLHFIDFPIHSGEMVFCSRGRSGRNTKRNVV